MCAKEYISEISPGEEIDSQFLVSSSKLEAFKNKPGHYLSLVLSDKTGDIPAIAWEKVHDLYKNAGVNKIVRVYGRVQEYRGSPQIVVVSIICCNDDEYDLADFIPHVDKDIEWLKGEFYKYVDSVKNTHLRQLLKGFFPDPTWRNLFEKAPGGKSVHHDYIGGLLEHTLEVIKLCDTVCEIFPKVDRDLLICGAVLHDIGKVDEYCYERRIDFTDEGKLLGHIVMGDRAIATAIEDIKGFPQDLALKLRHMIISHHGELEWGSPKRPKTIEACVLHYVDNLDAKVNQFSQIMNKHAENNGVWSDFEKTLGRSIYVGKSRKKEKMEEPIMEEINDETVDDSIEETAAGMERLWTD